MVAVSSYQDARTDVATRRERILLLTSSLEEVVEEVVQQIKMIGVGIAVVIVIVAIIVALPLVSGRGASLYLRQVSIGQFEDCDGILRADCLFFLDSHHFHETLFLSFVEGVVMADRSLIGQ